MANYIMSNRLPFVRLSSLHSLIININIGRFFIIFCVVLIVVQISYPRLSICLPFCCLDSLVLYERLDELMLQFAPERFANWWKGGNRARAQ